MKAKAEKFYIQNLQSLQKKYNRKEKNTSELNKMGKYYFGKKYIGTYPSDMLPQMKHGQYAIVNLDNSSQPGTHWIAVAKNGNKTLMYDSFGRTTYNIIPSLLQSGNGVIVHTERDVEQADHESNCGLRCISFLKVYDKYGFKGAKWI